MSARAPRKSTKAPRVAAKPKLTPAAQARRRVRHLVVLDATLVVKRLRSRQDEMLRLFSRQRDRAPLMAAAHTTFNHAGFDTLAALTPEEQQQTLAFFEVLAEVRWYLQYTEDMPGTLRTVLDGHLGRLDVKLRELVLVLGPAEAKGADVVDAQVVSTRAAGR